MISPRKNLDFSKYLLTDDFSEEGLIINKSNDNSKSKLKKSSNKLNEEYNLDVYSPSSKEKKKNFKKSEKKNKTKSESNVEFIIVEDENDEKKLVINLELKLKESIEGTELIKIDFEINQDVYLDLIKELLK